MKRHGKKLIIYSAVVLLVVYLCLCFFMRLSIRDTSFDEDGYMLYYIVNADGMKGLGHSILMVVDGEGCGTVLSYNGMQRSLWESLLGKSGIGKMSIGQMSAEDTEAFLQTGNLQFAVLYEEWAMEEDAGKKSEYEKHLEQMGQGDDLPVYRIYTNNCDHVARLLASSVDSELKDYTNNAWRMTPSGNFKAFGRKAKDWGLTKLGKQSFVERLLMFLMIF